MSDLTTQRRAEIRDTLRDLAGRLALDGADVEPIAADLIDLAKDVDPDLSSAPIRITIHLGTARTVTEYCTAAIDAGFLPESDAQRDELRALASTVAGPIYGNALGAALRETETSRA